MKVQKEKKIEWTLRIALFGEFLGHGIFALQLKQSFLDILISILGVNLELARTFLFSIGILDIIVAILALVYPFRLMLIWATIWGFTTALARPLTGDPVWDFVERWANWGVPLALFYLKGTPKKFKEWFK